MHYGVYTLQSCFQKPAENALTIANHILYFRILFRLLALLTRWRNCSTYREGQHPRRAPLCQTPNDVQSIKASEGKHLCSAGSHWSHDKHVPKTAWTSLSNQFNLDLDQGSGPTISVDATRQFYKSQSFLYVQSALTMNLFHCGQGTC
jgi:hypothetical protein